MFDLSSKIKPYKEIIHELEEYPIVTSNKKIQYYNIPASFDIEVSSFYEGRNKRSLMYIWMFGINGRTYYGRTWEEFLDLYNIIIDKLKLSPSLRLVVYVHNLSYEFQFIRKLIKWDNVFATGERTPLYATSVDGVEFRCSYLLSGTSLAKMGEDLIKYKVEKKIGDLDYYKVRTPLTPLTPEEMGYCENDVKVVMAYIQEKLESGERLDYIPLTKTGYVRKGCKRYCYYLDKRKKENEGKTNYHRYRDIIANLTLNDAKEYRQLKRAYQGGFTHANPLAIYSKIPNVRSYDFTSSYPTTCIAEYFPMSKGTRVKLESKEEFFYYMKYYCCMFDVEVWDLKSKAFYEFYLSSSKCYKMEGEVECNGRIVEAKHLITTLTDVDFEIFQHMYKYGHIKISNFIYYDRGYLPKPIIKYILKLYKDKTELKGVNGKEVEYMLAKGNINSIYGMMVTDFVRGIIKYDSATDSWISENDGDIDKAIIKYNKSRNRFLFFPWGVWITAYARRNLFTGITEFGKDYIYSDTDSLKVVNYKNHLNYINTYNEHIIKKLEKTMLHYHLPVDSFRPKNLKGEEKILGVWDDEGEYDYFKTLGAKRYITMKNGKLSATIAGLPKSSGKKYLEQFEDPFKEFRDDMDVPYQMCGKLCHVYLDDNMDGIIKDYLGTSYEYHEPSGIHMEQIGFNLSMGMRFVEFLTKHYIVEGE